MIEKTKNKLHAILEERGKIMFQVAKEMKKVHIFKFMCTQTTYWDFDKAMKKPKLYKTPEGKKYILRKAATYYFSSKNKEELKKMLMETILLWVRFYHDHHGCLASISVTI